MLLSFIGDLSFHQPKYPNQKYDSAPDWTAIENAVLNGEYNKVTKLLPAWESWDRPIIYGVHNLIALVLEQPYSHQSKYLVTSLLDNLYYYPGTEPDPQVIQNIGRLAGPTMRTELLLWKVWGYYGSSNKKSGFTVCHGYSSLQSIALLQQDLKSRREKEHRPIESFIKSIFKGISLGKSDDIDFVVLKKDVFLPKFKPFVANIHSQMKKDLEALQEVAKQKTYWSATRSSFDDSPEARKDPTLLIFTNKKDEKIEAEIRRLKETLNVISKCLQEMK